jgi:translocation and assembly module TamB
MSEPESRPSISPEPSIPPKARRGRRRLLLSGAGLALVVVVAAIGFCFWASSAGFERMVRNRLVALIEQSTGGRVEIASFHWHLFNFEAEAGGLVIHGLEAPGEVPYASVEHVRVKWSILGFWSPRILLRELDVARPEFHVIVYPDGSSNQPTPRHPRKPGKSAIDTLFDLQAGHVSVEHGALDYEDRASDFDFQDRFTLADFDANNVSLLISYVPAVSGAPGVSADKSSTVVQESYRIEAGAADLNIFRGSTKQVRGSLHVTLDLTRAAVYLRSLRITSQALDAKGQSATERNLDMSGSLRDFARPRWQGKAAGDLDMALLDPIFGFPFSNQGTAHVNLDGAGQGADFRVDGSVHVDNGCYVGTGVIATGIRLDTHVHADANHLLFTSIVAHLRQGGQLEGELALSPWLPPIAGETMLQAPPNAILRGPADRNHSAPHRPPPVFVPFNGKVTARLSDVSLDTLLGMVSPEPFQRLGLDALIGGPATATWSHGDQRTLSVSALVNLKPSGQTVPAEVPASGLVDATYTQRDGVVDLRRLELHAPASEMVAYGKLGAFPLTSPSAFSVEFHSRNLNEFDTVLRDLGLNRYGKSGAAAMPISLGGQLDFLQGQWTGSILSPRIAGSLKATQLSIEMLPVRSAAGDKSHETQPVQPTFVRWDTVNLTGSYAAERIAISQGVLRRGQSEISLNGTLDAGPARGKIPGAFDGDSMLHMHLRAGKVGLDDLLPLTGYNLPVAGTLSTQLQLDGQVGTLGGSGWVELDDGSVYGEPVDRLRAQGTVANKALALSSVSVNNAAGAMTGSGSYDLTSHHFQVDARGSGIDVAKIETARRGEVDVAGKLGFQLTGSGTLDDPRLEGHATVSKLSLSGQPLGDLEVLAHSANRSITYSATTGLESAQLEVHGQTALSGDYPTHAKLDFSRFNIGALLKTAHVESISGESALAGTVTVDGPLAHLEQMRGEATLQQLAVTLAGVHLESQGGAHATLANSRINLDPLHVTGEETDLHAQGSLDLRNKQQLDIAASGSINLKLAESIDPDLTASGTTTFQVEAHGPLKNPALHGSVDFQDGSLSLEDLPNGLSKLHGTLEFNQNRLEVKSLTAMTGGGLLSVSGYLAYQHGIYADLSVTGKGVRIRYPAGISSLADSTLRLQGSQNNLLLSGNVLITRFSVSPDLDFAALAAQANAVQAIAPPDAPSNHIRLDVHVVSAPQLNFQNAYAKLAGDVDLHVRGTVASPSLLGRVSITEGSAIIAGTRYDLQRGEISFTNPVRIEPTLDLNATARVEDYDITLSLNGTPARMAVTYRSDPPLPESDVVALLALGRTQSQERLYTQQQEQAFANPTTDSLLGGALNATVSSRVQKLFGAGSVKVDPNYLGALGTSTSRIIVEEQLGRDLTLTYATDVDTTGQQLLQAEVAINRHVSLVVARDESGVFSMVLKATRRYR